MGQKEATNGEPGLVVEMTTPLTPWWGTKRPQMVSQALWLKCPHHLLPDRGTKRPQMVSQALWLKWPHHLHTDGAQWGHKWWVSPYEPNEYLNIPGDCHLWTGDWWSVQMDLTIVWRLCDDAYMLTIPSVKSYIYKTPYILSEHNIEMSIHLLPWNITYLLYFNGTYANF